MSRWQAALVHLSISIAIGLISAILIFGVWYPSPYSSAMGALELVLLLMTVDIVLGPMLTLVVFKSGKKYLRVDLAIIGVAQACALIYGLSVVVRARPVFIVAAIDRFSIVAANDIDAADLAQGSKAEFRSLSWTGPRVVGVQLPTNKSELSELTLSTMAGKDVERIPKYYVDYANVSAALLKHARSLAQLYKRNPAARPAIETWLRHHEKAGAGEPVCVPIVAPRMELSMLLDPTTAKPLDAVAVNSW